VTVAARLPSRPPITSKLAERKYAKFRVKRILGRITGAEIFDKSLQQCGTRQVRVGLTVSYMDCAVNRIENEYTVAQNTTGVSLGASLSLCDTGIVVAFTLEVKASENRSLNDRQLGER
jgi:hypothetical protein